MIRCGACGWDEAGPPSCGIMIHFTQAPRMPHNPSDAEFFAKEFGYVASGIEKLTPAFTFLGQVGPWPVAAVGGLRDSHYRS